MAKLRRVGARKDLPVVVRAVRERVIEINEQNKALARSLEQLLGALGEKLPVRRAGGRRISLTFLRGTDEQKARARQKKGGDKS